MTTRKSKTGQATMIRAKVTGTLTIPFRAVVEAESLADAENRVIDRMFANLSRLDGRLAIGACEAKRAQVVDMESVQTSTGRRSRRAA